MEISRQNFIGGLFALATGMCLPSIAYTKQDDDIVDIRNRVVSDIWLTAKKYLRKVEDGECSLPDLWQFENEAFHKTFHLRTEGKIHRIFFMGTIPHNDILGMVFGIKKHTWSETRYFRFSCTNKESLIPIAKEWGRKEYADVKLLVDKTFKEWLEKAQNLAMDASKTVDCLALEQLYYPYGNQLSLVEGVHKLLRVLPSKANPGTYDVQLRWSYADWGNDEDVKTLTATIKTKEIA